MSLYDDYNIGYRVLCSGKTPEERIAFLRKEQEKILERNIEKELETIDEEWKHLFD